MALHKHAPAPVARYITVQDATDRIGVAERTMRRWIVEAENKKIDDTKKKFHDIVRDPSGFVRLNLDEVERIVQERGGVAPSMHQRVDALLERIDELESEKEVQAQKVGVLQQQMAGVLQLLTHLQGTQEGGQVGQLDFLFAHLPIHRRSANSQELVAKRGLPPETMRLVDFAKVHQVNLWDIKQRSFTGEITLEIYHREGDAKRNKQEWWVTPAQHQQIVDYCQQHQIPYTPCPACVTHSQEEQKTF